MTRSFVIVPQVPEILLYFFQSIFSLLFRLDDFSCSNQVHLPFSPALFVLLLIPTIEFFILVILSFNSKFLFAFSLHLLLLCQDFLFVLLFFFFPGMFIILNLSSFLMAVLKSLSDNNSNGYLVIVFSHVV